VNSRRRKRVKSSLSPFILVLFFFHSIVYAVENNFTCPNPADFEISVDSDGTPVKYNVNGDLQIIGNSIVCADNNKDGICTDPGNTRNNSIYMINNDVDTNTTTFNSSSALLTLPANAQVLWAGLQWQGMLYNGTDDEKNKASTVKFHSPDMNTDAYDSIDVSDSSYRYNWVYYTSSRFYFQGKIDITEYVRNGGSGWYTVADLFTATGPNLVAKGELDGIPPGGSYGAWSIVVVYRDSAAALKNLTVYDGYVGVVTSGDYTSATDYAETNNCSTSGVAHTMDIPLDGFLTPRDGNVSSTLLMFAGEGDITATGDHLSLTDKSNTSVRISNAVNPQDDVLNASISKNGENISSSELDPYYGNNYLGIDIDTFDVSNIIENNQSSTTATFDTEGDGYHPGILAFSTELYEPEVCYLEEIYFDDNSTLIGDSEIYIGQKLTFVVEVRNRGIDDAQGLFVQNPFILQVAYDENSTSYRDINSSYFTHQTDTPLDDYAEYNSTTTSLELYIGKDVNVTAPSGGTLKNNENISFEYTAFPIGIPENNTSEMVYTISYRNATTGVTVPPTTMPKCVDFNSTFRIKYDPFTGEYDAVDTRTNLGVIQTKIANKSFNLDLVHLNSARDAMSPIETGVFVPVVATMSNTCSIGGRFIGGANFEAGDEYKTFPVNDGNVSSASKEQYIVMSFFSWDDLFTDASFNCSASNPSANLKGVPQCLNSTSKITQVFSPTEKDISICTTGINRACQSQSYNSSGPIVDIDPPEYNHPYGCVACLADQLNSYSCSDNFAIRPEKFDSNITSGQIFVADKNSSVTFSADAFSTSGTTDYNETMNTSFVVDINISDSSKTCAAPSIQITPNIAFLDGNVTNNNYSFGNVGDFNLTIHEKNGSEFALVDTDDTPDSDRLITPFTTQIQVIPHHFDVNASLTNGSNGFTYLSDFESFPNIADINISALLDINTTARSLTNNILTNYSKLCYAKDGNVTISLNSALDINPSSSLTKMLWNDGNQTNEISPLSDTSYLLDINSTQFDNNSTNGTVRISYRINFDRNSSNEVNPFKMEAIGFNVTDEDGVTGNNSNDQNATFYYGRVHAPDQRFDDNNGTAKVYYEVYCDGCNKVDFNITGDESIDSINWFKNMLHDTLNNGNVSLYDSVGSTIINPTASINITDGNESLIVYANHSLPYKDKINITSSPWLIFNPTDFIVEFYKSGSWAGQGIQGKTVDLNISVKQNKRLDW